MMDELKVSEVKADLESASMEVFEIMHKFEKKYGFNFELLFSSTRTKCGGGRNMLTNVNFRIEL